MSASNVMGETSEMTSEKQGTAGFRLEIDRLDIRPFSEDFSSFMKPDESGDLDKTMRNSMITRRLQDMSYNIERVTDIRAIAPEWHEDVDEIVIMSPKLKGSTTPLPTQILGVHDPQKPSTLSDFEILYDLADKGKTQTTLVRSSLTGELCVLKRLRKSMANGDDSAADIWSERVILEALKPKDIPFLINLQTIFEDEDYCSLVLDYYPGGDLLSYIAREGPLPPDRVLLFSSEIAQGIGALHDLKITHHNLRAENVMIDPRGHIVLIGFGQAECISLGASPNHPWLRNDLGESQPPELILGWKYDSTVDCWGFGILLYMMQVGRHPFGIAPDSRNQGASIRHKIIRDPLPFHALSGVSSAAQDLVMKCLERNPALRFNIEQIQAHEYFATVKWFKLTELGELRRISSPELDTRSSAPSAIDRTVALSSETATADHFTHQKPGFKLSGSSIQGEPNEEPESRTKGDFIEMGQDTVLDIKAWGSVSHNALEMCGDEDTRLVSGGVLASECGQLPCGLLLEHRQRRSSVASHPHPTGRSVSSSAKPSTKLRRKFRSMHFACIPRQPPQELPKGVEQRGKGIGFTFSEPTANKSCLTVCSTVPSTCYGSFWRSLSFVRKKPAQPVVLKARICDKSTQNSALVQRPEAYTFMSESVDSFPVDISPVLSSAFSDTAVESPNSVVTDANTLTYGRSPVPRLPLVL